MKPLIKYVFALFCLLQFASPGMAQKGTQLSTINPRPNKTGTAYMVWVLRDLSVYPFTSSGTNSFTTAVASGQFSLTLVGGGNCVIPAGVAPGLTPPVCAPAWISGLRYSYANGLLSFDAYGDVGQLKFEHVDGSGFTTSNPHGVPITSGIYYGPGPLSNQGNFNKQWQLNYVNAPLRVTAQQASSTSTHAFILNPISGADKVVLIGGTTTTPPPSTTTTPPPSTTTTPPPTTTNTTGYTAAQLNALGLDGNYLAAIDQGWNVQQIREKYIETSQAKIGIHGAGGGITYAALKRDNRNLVNVHQVGYDDEPGDYRYNTQTDDLGRAIQTADYMSPAPTDQNGQGLIFLNGKKTGNGYRGHIFNTGYNTVQMGSLWPALDQSPLLASATYTHPTRGPEIYVKTRPYIWGVKKELGWEIIEQWVSFSSPTVLHVKIRKTIEDRDLSRVANQRTYGSYSQENPCFWLVRDLEQKIINLPGESNKNIDPGPNGDSQKWLTSDCKIGAYGSGTGVTYYSRINSLVGALNRTPEPYSGGSVWYENNTAYISGAPHRNYDNAGIYEDEFYIHLGTQAEANAALAELPGPDQSYDFDFTKENMNWWNGDCRLIRENGYYSWYLDPHTDNGVTSFNGKFMAPFRAWQASGIQSVNFDIAVTGASTLKLLWQKPGLNSANEFQKEFSVQNDGQFHTYTVSTADPNFNGILSSVGLIPGNIVGSGGKVIVRRIYKN